MLVTSLMAAFAFYAVWCLRLTPLPNLKRHDCSKVDGNVSGRGSLQGYPEHPDKDHHPTTGLDLRSTSTLEASGDPGETLTLLHNLHRTKSDALRNSTLHMQMAKSSAAESRLR